MDAMFEDAPLFICLVVVALGETAKSPPFKDGLEQPIAFGVGIEDARSKPHASATAEMFSLPPLAGNISTVSR